jgi:hypothetical protein
MGDFWNEKRDKAKKGWVCDECGCLGCARTSPWWPEPRLLPAKTWPYRSKETGEVYIPPFDDREHILKMRVHVQKELVRVHMLQIRLGMALKARNGRARI